MAENERLFFALWPPEAVQRRMAEVGDAALHGRGRRTPTHNLHLTLLFLGELEAEARACIESVADALESPPFTLVLDRFGHFPRPQVAWVGTEEAPRPLIDLVGGLARGLRRCGLPPPRRAFRAHVTLARKVRRAHARPIDPIEWPVERFTLVRSTLTSEGAQYDTVRDWPLRGDA